MAEQGTGSSWFARHKVLTGLGVLLLLVVIGAAVGGSEDDGGGSAQTSASASASAASSPDAQADDATASEDPGGGGGDRGAPGSPVRDGKFEFTVTDGAVGIDEVGGEFLNKQAQGQFVRVTLQVENIGDEPQSLFADNQKLYDQQGREFSADSEATIYAASEDDPAGGASTLYSEINPGNSLTGDIYFDVPADAVPDYLELHDSAFSGGVEVQLG